MIEINDQIEQQIVLAADHDSQVEVEANDELLTSVFDARSGSNSPYCINRSRSITC